MLCFLWASYQIRKIVGCACAVNVGNVFPRRWLQRKPLVSGPDMHHGTCVTHVPWCTSESLTRGGGENVPGIPGACATRKFTYLVRGPWSEKRQAQVAVCERERILFVTHPETVISDRFRRSKERTIIREIFLVVMNASMENASINSVLCLEID